MEAHRYGVEYWLAFTVYKWYLHKFAAIDGAVAWFEIEIIGSANIFKRIVNTLWNINEAAVYSAYDDLPVALVNYIAFDETVDGINAYTLVGGFDGIGTVIVLMEYRNVIYTHFIDSMCDICDGVWLPA